MPRPPPASPPPPPGLQDRLGPERWERRRQREAEDQNLLARPSPKRSPLEFLSKSHGLIRLSLQCTGLWGRARHNARNLSVVHHRLPVAGLHPAWNGYRVLHIADMHFECSPSLVENLMQRVADVAADITVCTGDFRFDTSGPIDACLADMRKLTPHLPGAVFTVLGNHDCLAMVPELEAMGVRVLLNEGVALDHMGARLWLAGLDDPHHFETDDLATALEGAAADDPILLLAHAAERWQEAEAAGVGAYLCGHTHGGQVCLPGGRPVFNHAQAPREFVSGPWQHGRMHGYTSRGCGCTGLEARFFCPPEITVHTLVPAD